MPKIHDLKILPTYFDDVAKGRKTFELRFDDRGYLRAICYCSANGKTAHIRGVAWWLK